MLLEKRELRDARENRELRDEIENREFEMRCYGEQKACDGEQKASR